MKFRRDKNGIQYKSHLFSAETAGTTKTEITLFSCLNSGATSGVTKTHFPLFSGATFRRDKNICITYIYPLSQLIALPSRGDLTRAALLCGARVRHPHTVTKEFLYRLAEVPA